MSNIERIEFVTGELKKISGEIEKSGGLIYKVEEIGTDPTMAKITLVWSEGKEYRRTE